MAKLSTEQATYIQNQQEYLANARVGQFAKFLNKNPIYVTYYVINHANSRTDAGTGAIYEEIGPNAPMRFNKILELPAFNFPELRPDIVDDEGGYDINLDLTDIAFLPGTIRPKPGDYMLVSIAGVVPLLFRCNQMHHNSIQSNDYYMADFDLVDIKQGYAEQIELQVLEIYCCNFDAIGTNQKVFISEVDQNKIDEIQDLIDQLVQFYNDSFYNADIDGFVLYDASAIDRGSGAYNGLGMGTQWYVDNYLTRFINESEIFCDASSDHTLMLTYPELLPLNFDMAYRRSVWYAVLKQSREYLNVYTYAWSRLLQKRTSPLMMASIPCLHPTVELFDHYVKPEEKPPEHLKGFPLHPAEICGWAGYDPMLRPYFSLNLSKAISTGTWNSTLGAVERMIAQFIKGGPSVVTYEKKELIETSFSHDMFTFMHLPIIIYILKQQIAALTAKSTE